MKTSQIFIALSVSFCIAQQALSQWDTPDHSSLTCVGNPSELQQRPEMTNWLASFQDKNGVTGLDAMVGTWKFSMIIARAQIAFRYDSDGFYVQSEDDPEERVSLCLDQPKSEWLRVSVHSPACPETKNLYVRSKAVGRLTLQSFATRKAPSKMVTFKKVSNSLPTAGMAKPAPKCVMQKPEPKVQAQL